jgi:carotenoid cleavage dioxygenase-like enzyme
MAIALKQRTAEDLQGRLRGFHSGAREIDDAEVAIEGSPPAWLDGRLLLNGPALWELPRGSYAHWFDGLAMLHRIDLRPGRARYRSRFVQSEDYRASIARGAPAFGEFDTPDPDSLLGHLRHLGDPRVTDNPAVVLSRIGDRWIATTETPHLTGFDPDTLETTGRLAFVDGERLHLLSAHGITEPSGTYWNVGIGLGARSEVKLFRIRPGGAAREVVGRIRVAKPGYTHAFAMTARRAVIWETAMRAQPLSFVLTRRAYIRNFRWEPRSGSKLHAVSLDDGSVRTWELPPMMCFHPVQAWDDGQDVVAELVVYEDARIFDDLALERLRQGVPPSYGRMVRYRLRPGRDAAEAEELAAGLDLSQVHPGRVGRGRATVTWAAAIDVARPSFFDRTIRLDLERGDRREWRRPGATHLEPLFVPRPGGASDDDGVLLVPTLSDEDPATVIGVLDARELAPLAFLRAPQVVPFGFHGAWAPRV